ncbi:hypothetical protein [Methanopyrus sp. SNP6]|uniref:hypothetical protein n=1 Tax=Methanopyrus sp. SNP6 TaxID=1937005 RepID=UPI001439CD06|nr:hypothetical protein [Methanopyrus sp. SNP6]
MIWLDFTSGTTLITGTTSDAHGVRKTRDRLQAGLMLYTDRRSVTALDHVEALKVLK